METDEEQVRYDRLTEVFQKSRPNQLPEPLISPCSVLKNYGMIEKNRLQVQRAKDEFLWNRQPEIFSEQSMKESG
uniref:hypothetical protein n=1 Tax=Clostridium sp. NkU-1 TaxID=1095009 RepID=UPI000B338D54